MMMASVAPTAGRFKEITAVSNPIIKSIKALNQKKIRDKEGVFLVEGLKLIIDAVELGWDVRTLLFANTFKSNQQLQAVAANVRTKGADIIEVSEKVLGSITRRDNPQMVVGIVAQTWVNSADIFSDNEHVWIALDRVRDPGNLGTIIRTADAVGAQGIILVGETTDPYSVEAVRATMGSVFNIKLCKLSETQFEGICRKWKGQVIGTHLEGAVDYRSLRYEGQSTLLLMGNEQQGLPDELAEKCDQLAYIPMNGKADSLNLAISTGIMLYEIFRHRLKMKSE